MTPGKHTAECARKAIESVMRRAYRRPVTPAEVDAKYKLVAVARKEGDSLDEGVRLALQAILVSPDFLFHIERDPKAAAGRTIRSAITNSRRACLTSCGPACPTRNCRGSPIRDNCASRTCWRSRCAA